MNMNGGKRDERACASSSSARELKYVPAVDEARLRAHYNIPSERETKD